MRCAVVRCRSFAVRNTCRVLRVACCVLLLTACQFPGTVRPTVKIGLVAPFEGRYRYIGYDTIYAVRLALHEANAAGGIGGYSVELAAYDDGADPRMAVEQARKLAVDPAVVAAIGHFREETTGAALDAYAEAGIPLVSPAVLTPVVGRGEAEVYRVGPTAEAVGSALFNRLGELGQYRAALVTAGGPLGEVLQRDAQAYGQRTQPVVSPDDVDWLATVIASGAGAVLCDADPVTAGEVVSALQAAGWDGVFLGGPELAAADFRAVAGKAAEGAVFVTPWPFPVDVPDGADFVEAYRAVSNGVAPGPLAVPAYEATWVLLEALERDIAAHREPSRQGMMGTLPDTGRDGLLGTITFGAAGDWGAAPLHWYYVSVEGILEYVP